MGWRTEGHLWGQNALVVTIDPVIKIRQPALNTALCNEVGPLKRLGVSVAEYRLTVTQ